MRTDYTVVRRDTRTLEFDITLADNATLNLEGATVEFIVDGLFTREMTVDTSSGEVSLTLESEDTEGAPDQRHAYPYQVKVTELDGDVFTPQRGLFIVLPDLTAET